MTNAMLEEIEKYRTEELLRRKPVPAVRSVIDEETKKTTNQGRPRSSTRLVHQKVRRLSELFA